MNGVGAPTPQRVGYAKFDPQTVIDKDGNIDHKASIAANKALIKEDLFYAKPGSFTKAMYNIAPDGPGKVPVGLMLGIFVGIPGDIAQMMWAAATVPKNAFDIAVHAVKAGTMGANRK